MIGFYKSFSLFTVLLFSMLVCSCDDGDIVESSSMKYKDGYVVKITGTFSNMSSWSDLSSSYSVVLAGFEDGEKYPVIFKSIPVIDTAQNFVLSGIETSVSTIELCVVNTINQRVVSYKTIFDVSANEDYDPADTIYFDAAGMDLSVYNGIQTYLFSGKGKCFQCHRGAGSAANLNFTNASDSYAELVGVESATVAGSKRVTPGDADNSILYKVVTNDASTGALPWHYDHVSNIDGLTYNMQNVIKEWINAGASDK